MRSLLTAILLCLVTPVLAAEDMVLNQGQARSEAFLEGDMPSIWDDFSPQLQQLFGTIAGLETFREELKASLGEETEVIDQTVVSGEGLKTYIRTSRWSRSDAPIRLEMGIAPDGTVVRFLVQPQQGLAESRFLDYATRTPLRLPFAGQWYVVWGGRTLEQNYHGVDRAQRFATDLLISRDGATHEGESRALESYYCWDEPILAPAAGTVARVVADLPDNPIGETDTANPAGNHVVLDFGNGEFAFLGHMRQGSIRLEPGDTVTAGEELGRCGNSGNTSEPHLHFHLQTTPELRDGEGLPAFFTDYVADGQPVTRGEPQAGQFIEPAR